MGRTYAGILGPVAFLTVLARSLVRGSDVAATFQVACVCLFAFAAIGWVVGELARQTVDESVRATFAAEIEAQDTSGQNAGA